MTSCAQCGAGIAEDAAFCARCGTPAPRGAPTVKPSSAAHDPLVVDIGAEPAVPAATGAAEQVVLTIGDIGVSRHWVVTPNGSALLAGSTWIARDMSRTESKIPTWAIVCAIVFALACLLGLLFLLAKEQTTTGYVEVSVQQGSLYHVTQIPVSSPYQLAQVRQLVYQAQTMAAAA